MLASPVVAGAQEQRMALVIGNGEYQHNETLANPPNDAVDMAAALKKDGFSVSLLKNASRKEMEQAVRAFGIGLKNPEAIGLFYYSGHGAQADGANYLLPVDADIQDADELAYNAVDAESVLAKMRSAGNKLNIVVLDACRDNPFPGASRSAERGLAIVKVKVPESVIVYATDPGSTASDGTGRNSPFTKAFLENMDAPGQDITEMMKHVTRQVQTDTDGKQTPWVSTNLTKDFAFKAGAAPPAAVPTTSAARSYGSIMVASATRGMLYVDGKFINYVSAGSALEVDSVEPGDRNLEIRYVDGHVERRTASVAEGSAASVAFTYSGIPQVPKASIKIDGKFDDWSEVAPVFTSGLRVVEDKKLAIEAAYLAVDEKNLYMRFDIQDLTPSSLLHPNNFCTHQDTIYGFDLFNGTYHLQAHIQFHGNSWTVALTREVGGRWDMIGKAYDYAMRGASLEASFPLSLIKQYLGTSISGGYYEIAAFSGFSDGGATWHWVQGDYIGRKKVLF